MSGYRLPAPHGVWIDRSRALRLNFNGQEVPGFAGDTVASALLGSPELVLLDAAGFERWCAHAPFRRFVFSLFAERLSDMMSLAEAVAFQRLDQRLAHALLGRGNPVHATHQELADELGTVREIVTRLLKRFERDGWVALSRERIEIVDAATLRAVAQSSVR